MLMSPDIGRNSLFRKNVAFLSAKRGAFAHLQFEKNMYFYENQVIILTSNDVIASYVTIETSSLPMISSNFDLRTKNPGSAPEQELPPSLQLGKSIREV